VWSASLTNEESRLRLLRSIDFLLKQLTERGPDASGEIVDAQSAADPAKRRASVRRWSGSTSPLATFLVTGLDSVEEFLLNLLIMHAAQAHAWDEPPADQRNDGRR
jgi:hypothetical protein